MFTRRCLLILAMLSLIILLAPACGGNDGDDEATSETSQATTATSAQPASTQPATATASKEPVKIGVVMAWSGPTAMAGLYITDPVIKVVEKQVEDMGGILGGRPVKFIRCDNSGRTAESAACAKKLILNEKVSAMTLGGVSGSEASAIADVAEQEKVLFATLIAGIGGLADRKYTVVCSVSIQSVVDDATRLLLEVMTPQPRTVGIMTYDEPESRNWVADLKQNIEDAGLKIVYEEYLTPGTLEYSPYLTRIKYEDPDVLIVQMENAAMMALAKQILGLGGWGDIQVVGWVGALAAVKMPGAEGWIVISPWHLAKDDAESIKFRKYYEAVNNKSPEPNHVYIYNTLWTAIHAIELAGTDDPVAIAKAARSGDLEFDTPMGRAHFNDIGEIVLSNMFVQIQKGGVTVPYPQ